MPYLLRHLSQARSIIEESFKTADPLSELMTEAYGTHVFKCSVISCPRFRHGYKNDRMRGTHEANHRGRFECTHKGCDFSILGFSTGQELAKHMIEHNSLSDAIRFPKVQRCSLRKSLESAIDRDDAVAVRALCAEAPDTLPTKSYLLKRALNEKSRQAMKVLLQVLPIEAKTNSTKTYATMAMHLAAEEGDEELANLVIAMGADLEPQRSEIILKAAKRGDAQLVKLWLNPSGRALDLTLKRNQAPLLVAAECGHEEVLRILLDKHGEAYAQTRVYKHAILLAGSNGHDTAVRFLLEKSLKLSGTSIHSSAVNDSSSNLKSMFAKVVQQIPEVAGEILQAIIYKGDIEKALRIFKAGADINQIFVFIDDFEPWISFEGTALSIAADRAHLTLVEELLDRGADIDMDPGPGTALAQAVGRGDVAVTNLLLGRRADVNAGNGEALRRGVKSGHDRTVKLLLDIGADVNLPIRDATLLQIAIEKGYVTIVELLLEYGADVYALSNNSDTALHLATRCGHLSIVSLLGQVIDINQKKLI